MSVGHFSLVSWQSVAAYATFDPTGHSGTTLGNLAPCVLQFLSRGHIKTHINKLANLAPTKQLKSV